MTVTEKGQTTRTGTYEINDQNVLIMTFKDETISYLIEYDSDGNMRWVHSYNGFEDVIYPTSIPKAKQIYVVDRFSYQHIFHPQILFEKD